MNTLKDFINFVKRPKEFFSEKLSSKEKLKILLILLFWQHVLVLFIIYPFLFLVNEYLLPLQTELRTERTISFFLSAVLIAPFLEETLFRLPLRYKRNYIFQFFDFISGNRMQKVWMKYYGYFFYIFAIAFGLFHILNFKNNELLFYCIAPFLVVSQLVGGLFLGYIRLRIGFFWGVLFHSLFNGILFGGSILFFHNIETISYSDIEIQKFSLHELQYIDKDSQSSEIIKNANGDLIELHFNDMNLQGVIDSLGLKKNLKESDRWINLEIFAPKGISKEKIVEILEKEYKFE